MKHENIFAKGSTHYKVTNVFQQQFFQLPKLLVYGEKYKNLTSTEIVAYSILLDRLQVSIKNKWYDKNGDIYFVYPNKELMRLLRVSEKTVIKVKKELTNVGLLEEIKTGRANKMYLNQPTTVNEEESRYILECNKVDEPSQKQNINSNQRSEVNQNNSAFYYGENSGKNDENSQFYMADCKNYSSGLENIQPSNTNISKTKTYETYETNESSNHHQLGLKNAQQEIKTSEYQREDGSNLPAINIYNFKEKGIPDFITSFVYNYSSTQDEFNAVFECIFKAKTNVSKRCKHLILLEELAPEDFVEMRNVIYRTLHKRKTDENLRNYKGYLMASLIKYYEDLCPYVAENQINTEEPTMEVPLIDYTKEQVPGEMEVPLIDYTKEMTAEEMDKEVFDYTQERPPVDPNSIALESAEVIKPKEPAEESESIRKLKERIANLDKK